MLRQLEASEHVTFIKSLHIKVLSSLSGEIFPLSAIIEVGAMIVDAGFKTETVQLDSTVRYDAFDLTQPKTERLLKKALTVGFHCRGINGPPHRLHTRGTYYITKKGIGLSGVLKVLVYEYTPTFLSV